MINLKVQIYPMRFIPGGDGEYYFTHTWAGRAYDWGADWQTADWDEASAETREFTALTPAERTFSEESGVDVLWWVYDP